MDLKLDISGYPPYITPKDLEEQYGMCRITVLRRIQDGHLPPLQSNLNSQRPGWSREYFVMWLMEKARRDVQMQGMQAALG
ncbi:MAG: hypothetical protein LLF76_02945 [Planctomycetaceae bacterium]|nr:hypothetical protein [Planctomycetaceae bacterium]